MRRAFKNLYDLNLRWVGLVILVLSVGCGGGGGDGDAGGTSAAKDEAAAPAVDPATAATVTGRVEFSGTAPIMQLIDVASEAVCHTRSETEPVYAENVVLNDNGTLSNVFVYVKDGLEGKNFPASSEPVVLDQIGCQYQPHVIGIQVGQPLKIKNSDDGVLHNIHALSEGRNGFNCGMPKVMESTKKFKKPEVMVRIKCDVHGWMAAYAGVVDHPFFGVTGEDGSFEFPPLPPGDYVIESWHEEYGTQTQNVTVGASETKEITFTFSSS